MFIFCLKEMCVHLATQHQLLEGLMVEPDPAIQRIKKILYPNVEEVDVKVKSEPLQPEADQEDPDDPDDPDNPPAKMTSARGNVKPLTSVVVNKNVTPARVIQRPRVERIMNCFMCKDKVILWRSDGGIYYLTSILFRKVEI